MKKSYLNIFFQVLALILIVKVFFFEEVDYDKFAILRSKKLIILVSLSIIVHFIITYLFFKIISILAKKKTSYTDITSIYLQGAIINNVLPGLGYLFRYYKLKFNSNINLLIYTISQTIWSLNSILVYFIAALVLGFIIISDYIKIFYIFILILVAPLIVIKFRYKLINFLKKYLYKSKKILSFIKNFKNFKKIKKTFLRNKINFLFIFIGFVILLILECFIFNLSLNYFGIEISFFNSSYIWITSTLITVLVLINFFGLFEMIVALSASLIVPEIDTVLILAINLKIITLISMILIIVNCEILKKFIK